MPETAYASCGDLSLAYQVFGDGPIELVFVGPMASHVELLWTLPEFKSFFDQLATFCRVVLFDKAGLGLSDPIAKVRTLDERAAEIEAVMDAVGFTKPANLVVGSGTVFQNRGSAELRGVPGSWNLLAVDRKGAQPGSAEAKLASAPTPGRGTAMRPADRAVKMIARRTPWILRGVARLSPLTSQTPVRN
jgi:hypothetical protein